MALSRINASMVGTNGTISNAEYEYLNGTTSAIQTQIDGAGGGKVLQVVSTTKTDTFTTSSNTFTDVTGLAQAITCSATSSKVLVMSSIMMGCSGASERVHGRLMRDSTAIHVGGSSGSKTPATVHWHDSLYTNVSMQHVSYLDSPSSTSSLNYHWEVTAQPTSGFVSINRDGIWNNSYHYGCFASTITCIEIGA